MMMQKTMMLKTTVLGMLVAGLAACATPNNNETGELVPKIGMANPASEYCVKQGGQLEIKNEENGQVGYCRLANGQVVEEWALFRASQAECLPEEAKRLVGLANLSEAQIQEKTKAKTVRSVGPNQPVTMDFRSDRVTVVVDPKTQKITNASCG